MNRIQYTIWSTYPPALYKTPQGTVRIAAGTIYKLMVGDTLLPSTQPLPGDTSLQQFQWMRPSVPASEQKLQTKKVMGSKGVTYTITTTPTGRQTCTCPGYTFRKTCKHLGV